MRFASYLGPGGVPTWGLEQDGLLHDLGPSGIGLAADLREAIANGVLVEPLPDIRAAGIPIDQVSFLPVIPNPRKILCIGVNYKAHRDETGRADSVAPMVFTRFADSLAAAGTTLPIPAETVKYDYEGELALVIGAPADHVAREDAWSVVAGYAAFNDLSARDWQRHTTQWTPGKNFPQSGPFGPYFVPVTDISDVDALVLETRVNGDVRQRASVANLIFSIPEIIEYCTSFTPLGAGDVIVTGTPGGVGLFREPPTFLESGDVVEVEISGLGILRNQLS